MKNRQTISEYSCKLLNFLYLNIPKTHFCTKIYNSKLIASKRILSNSPYTNSPKLIDS